MRVGMKIFIGKQCLTHDLLTFQVSSALAAFLNHDRQAPLMPLSLNNNCPSTFPQYHPSQLNFIEQNVSIQENLDVAISKNDCNFQQQAHGMITGRNFTNCSFNFNFK